MDFVRDVAPILEDRCLKCHYPGNSKGDLSLATSADVVENDYLSPGDAVSSHFVGLLKSTDSGPAEMPKGEPPLSEEEIAVIARWIDAGAQWPAEVVLAEKSKADTSWWSLQPISSPAPPIELARDVAAASEQRLSAWTESPIDAFVLAKLVEQRLGPSSQADRTTLIRRATYDLTGLPPTPGEIAEFVSDPSDQAYEKLVDRLLASPRYGQRWGRHWLDVVRFGESTGYERNIIIEDAWPFRDYVITSFNADKPFDEFIREHIAGDCLDSAHATIGSGFLVNGPYDNVGNQDAAQAAQIRANTIDEMIRATSEAFLGLTVGCARCHDHKFDPIKQKDYYQLYATFAGVLHGSRVVASEQEKQQRAQTLAPLSKLKKELTEARNLNISEIDRRALGKLEDYEAAWTREPTDRLLTTDAFSPVKAKFVRLLCDSRDDKPTVKTGFRIDEFEIWSAADSPTNVALAIHGAKATGASRNIEDFPGAYGPQLVIDGKFGERFIANGKELRIELAKTTKISKVAFSNARGEQEFNHQKFSFVGDYRIQVSLDGESWQTVSSGKDRRPSNDEHRKHRLRELETSPDESKTLSELDRKIAKVSAEINRVPALETAWVGTRSDDEAKKRNFIFIGGNPAVEGDPVVAGSLSALRHALPSYRADKDATEKSRREMLAQWLTDPANPLPARVLANRVWHYHFGTGIVSTPSDFGFMGSAPTHPELLDWLAQQLIEGGWKLKPLHREIMLSQTYRQRSQHNARAAGIDNDARYLWRFPPRRLSAEEIRDSLLFVSGSLSVEMGGAGFRLYKYLQDNVATYVPLDEHGPETFRRAVYHQTARASRTDFMTDFDQPDCAFSTARRVSTTTPLQALCSLNHSFAIDISQRFASRLENEAGTGIARQVKLAFALCFARDPTTEELEECSALVETHSLRALCRVLLNSSELVYVR